MPNADYSVIDFYSGEKVSVDTLDEGVREVVCRLIDMGATPIASCDGHGKPDGWQVLFQAPLAVAQRVVDCGYLELHLCRQCPFPRYVNTGEPDWQLRLGPTPKRKLGYTPAHYTRARHLKEAVRGWLAESVEPGSSLRDAA